MVKDYFDCIRLVRLCFKSLRSQCKMKGVHLKGPIFEEKNDSVYFRQVFGDENRYR